MKRLAPSLAGVSALLIGLIATGPTREIADADGGGDAWWSKAQLEIERSEYRPSGSEGAFRAPNRAQGLRIGFDEGGVSIVPRVAEESEAWTFAWRTERWGRRGDVTQTLPAVATPRVDGARVVYARGAIDEWYENGPQGLEQGFTIHERLPGHEPFVLVGDFGGGLRPQLDAAEGAVDLVDEGGACRLRYAELQVWDAGGRVIPSHLALEGSEVALVIDDSDARYPLTVDPLMTSPAWTAEGNHDTARLGQCVATAGDVNGDGFSDVIVGADHYDQGAGLNGAVFVYHGSAQGLATTPAWTSPLDTLSVALGSSVAPAGDVNGDGYDDVIVADNIYGDVETPGEGRAQVYLGSPSGLLATPAWTAEGNQSNAVFGNSVATAGDVNDDGFSDVIVGAPFMDVGQENEGAAFVYLGSAAGLETAFTWMAQSNQAGAGLGVSVASAGDVNGDGYDDVIVGADAFTGAVSQEGKAFIYHGSATGLSTVAVWSAGGNQVSSHFAQSVAGAGDVNGDGYADIIVGAPFYANGETWEGRALIYMGSAAGVGATPVWTIESNQVNEFLGQSVATAGDVNGDGFADVIIGALRYDNGQIDEGRALVYLGTALGPSPSPFWTAESDQANALFGLSAATAGDVNGDGYSDIIVGAPLFTNGENSEGKVFVYHGSADGLGPSLWFAQGNQPDAQLGSAVGSAGDVNGDGYSDVIIAAPQFDNGQFGEGRVYVHHGSANGPSLTPSWSTESNQDFALMGFGTGAASAGDVNGDGYGDVIVGAPYFDNGQTDEGIARVHLGSSSTLLGHTFWDGESNQADAHYGISVASAGDVNGDGFDDIIVGAEQASNVESQEGRAFVYHGSATGLTLAWTAEPDQANASFGRSVASAGDVNGDGFSDVIVGAERYDAGQIDEGRAFVYLGSPSGLAASPAWTAESNQANAEFGSSVASAGDVNGDGYSDVIVGAQLFDGGQGNEGRAEIYLGSATGLARAPAWHVESNQVTAGVSMSVASAGDLNGDGFSDVIVGYPQASNGQTNEGRAFVYHGSATGPDTTADWIRESNQGSAWLGCSVASAGDVNGDGFSDVVIGSCLWEDDNSNEGFAQFFCGNVRDGLDRIPRQARANDSAPIALHGRLNAESSFLLKTRGRTAAGRANVRLVSEVKPLGVAFDGTGSIIGPSVDTGMPVAGVGSAVALSRLADGVVLDRPYHWRARAISDNPFFRTSPWLSPPGNASSETDLRGDGSTVDVPALPSSDVVVLLRLSPNPAFGPARIEYELPQPGRVRISVYDVQGRLVARPVDGERIAGRHAAVWDGEGTHGRVDPGIFFVQLEAAGISTTRRLVRLR